MNKESKFIEKQGIVVEALSNFKFRVKIAEEDNRLIQAYAGGNIRKSRIRILLGDKVLVQLTSYDPNCGRIIYRLK